MNYPEYFELLDKSIKEKLPELTKPIEKKEAKKEKWLTNFFAYHLLITSDTTFYTSCKALLITSLSANFW